MDDVMENHFYRLKRFYALIRRILYYYNAKQIPLASAALCYYMMMTFFPLIICLYTLLGNSYSRARRVLDFAENMLSADTVQTIRTFLNYVAFNHSQAMFIAGGLFLLTTASAGMRSLQATLGRMQGGHRFRALPDFLISFALAAALVFAVYFSMVVLLTGHRFLRWMQGNFSVEIADASWDWMRFLFLGGVALLLLWGLFGFTRPRNDRYLVLPGAMLSTVGIVAMGSLFSRLIASSTRYSLVYGSLASLILLMIWLYIICQTIFVGAALNIALRDHGVMRRRRRELFKNYQSTGRQPL